MIAPVRLALAIAVLMVLASLAGCAGQPTIQTVKVPVPVECREVVPDRPAMPTETPAGTFTLDGHVAALQAEINVREGYEGLLRMALEGCTRPIAPH